MLTGVGDERLSLQQDKEIATEAFGLSKADREVHEKWINGQRGILVSQINF